MKKYLYSALALPLLFACSSEDFDEKVVSNDQFAGIAKVDATFSMAEGATTRMANEWSLEEGDVYGFAWLTDAHTASTPYTPQVGITGLAYQNHNLIQTGTQFKPQTAIYVGKYFLYRPYDESVVSPAVINFSLAGQNLANDASEKHNGAPYQALAASAIIIGDKWTEVTETGTTIAGTTWDKAGIDQNYDLYAALFSNRTALDLTYKKNNPKFAAKTTISGATDINFDIEQGEDVGAADITKVTVDLQRAGASIAANAFTYGPTKEPAGGAAHNGDFWASVSNIPTAAIDGFTFAKAPITLTPAEKIETGEEGSKGWFWFNSLPVTAGNAALSDLVVTTYETSYGKVTINTTDGDGTAVDLEHVAYAREIPTAGGTAKEWIKFGNALTENVTLPKDQKIWDIAAGAHNTFVNQYGNHVGKYALTVDFSKGVMSGMHIKDDAHLQKALKYYIASGKSSIETGVVLNLDQAGTGANNFFKISKTSIALLQTINKTVPNNVLVQACTTHGTPKVIVTQEGSTGKTEVPDLDKVFAVPTDVFLAAGTDWTWKERPAIANYVTVDANVKSLTNEGTLTVNASNIQLSSAAPITNAKDATMNITKVTTVKNTLTNLGEINVPAGAELRAFAIEIRNEATALGVGGTINNGGVVGVTAGTTPAGQFNNYSYIEMTENSAITLLTSNQVTGNFGAKWATGNKMGTVKLPNGNATALVSVANATDQGFIKYEWPATSGAYSTPAGNVKYNTIVVNGENGDISFTTPELEIQFIEFNGTRTQVINPTNANLPNLKGIYVNAGKSIILEKTNTIDCAQGAYLGSGATVYRGGLFTKAGAAFAASDATAANNYFGGWDIHQIVEY